MTRRASLALGRDDDTSEGLGAEGQVGKGGVPLAVAAVVALHGPQHLVGVRRHPAHHVDLEACSQ